jgi:hypothetical protein
MTDSPINISCVLYALKQ